MAGGPQYSNPRDFVIFRLAEEPLTEGTVSATVLDLRGLERALQPLAMGTRSVPGAVSQSAK